MFAIGLEQDKNIIYILEWDHPFDLTLFVISRSVHLSVKKFVFGLRMKQKNYLWTVEENTFKYDFRGAKNLKEMRESWDGSKTKQKKYYLFT